MLGRLYRREVELDDDVVLVVDGLMNTLGRHAGVAPGSRELAEGSEPRAKVRNRMLDM